MTSSNSTCIHQIFTLRYDYDYALSTNERYIIFVRFNQQSYVLKHAMLFIGRNLYSWYSLESGEYCVQFTHKSHDTLCENLNKMEFTAFWLVGWMVVVSFAVIPMMAYAINQAKQLWYNDHERNNTAELFVFSSSFASLDEVTPIFPFMWHAKYCDFFRVIFVSGTVISK